MKNWVLAVAAVGEVLTGLVLLVYPPIVIKLLFGANIAGVGVIASRFAGVALIALSVACWPCGSISCALCGMLTYSSLATIGLLYLGLSGKWNGPLLWPAAVLHAVLTLLLARTWFTPHENGSAKKSGCCLVALLYPVSHATRVPPQL